MRPNVLLALLIVAAPGWAVAQEKWGPTWSEVSGQLLARATMNREPAIIKSIDGRSSLDKVVRAEPGSRKVVVQPPPRKGLQGANATLDMTLEPCKRYYINAQFKSGVGTDWEPVVERVEPISGCKTP